MDPLKIEEMTKILFSKNFLCAKDNNNEDKKNVKLPMQIQMGNQQFQEIIDQMFRSFGGEEMKFIISRDFRSKCLKQFSNSEELNIECRGMLKMLIESQDQHKSQNFSPKEKEPAPFIVSTFYVFIKNFVSKLYESSDKSNEFAWLAFYDKTWQKFMNGVYDVKYYFDLADAFKLSLPNWKDTFFFGTKCIATTIRELMQREWDGEHNCTRQISQATIISYKMLGFLNVPNNYEEFVVPPFKNRNDPPTPLDIYYFMDWHRQRFPVIERLKNMQIFIGAKVQLSELNETKHSLHNKNLKRNECRKKNVKRKAQKKCETLKTDKYNLESKLKIYIEDLQVPELDNQSQELTSLSVHTESNDILKIMDDNSHKNKIEDWIKKGAECSPDNFDLSSESSNGNHYSNDPYEASSEFSLTSESSSVKDFGVQDIDTDNKIILSSESKTNNCDQQEQLNDFLNCLVLVRRLFVPGENNLSLMNELQAFKRLNIKKEAKEHEEGENKAANDNQYPSSGQIPCGSNNQQNGSGNYGGQQNNLPFSSPNYVPSVSQMQGNGNGQQPCNDQSICMIYKGSCGCNCDHPNSIENDSNRAHEQAHLNCICECCIKRREQEQSRYQNSNVFNNLTMNDNQYPSSGQQIPCDSNNQQNGSENYGGQQNNPFFSYPNNYPSVSQMQGNGNGQQPNYVVNNPTMISNQGYRSMPSDQNYTTFLPNNVVTTNPPFVEQNDYSLAHNIPQYNPTPSFAKTQMDPEFKNIDLNKLLKLAKLAKCAEDLGLLTNDQSPITPFAPSWGQEIIPPLMQESIMPNPSYQNINNFVPAPQSSNFQTSAQTITPTNLNSAVTNSSDALPTNLITQTSNDSGFSSSSSLNEIHSTTLSNAFDTTSSSDLGQILESDSYPNTSEKNTSNKLSKIKSGKVCKKKAYKRPSNVQLEEDMQAYLNKLPEDELRKSLGIIISQLSTNQLICNEIRRLKDRAAENKSREKTKAKNDKDKQEKETLEKKKSDLWKETNSICKQYETCLGSDDWKKCIDSCPEFNTRVNIFDRKVQKMREYLNGQSTFED